MDELRDDVLDHVCCILESTMDEKSDFRSEYEKTIRTFYKEHLWEIEEETMLVFHLLLY